ncbi:MAG: PqqD family protein, partial [Acidimicrobiales bacterium]
MGTNTRFQINTPAVVSEDIDGEVVIVNLETGSYYSLRDSSAALWKLLEGGAAVEEASRILVEPNGADRGVVYEEVVAFIEELRAEQLVVESGEPISPSFLPPVDGHLQPGSLRLERYDEMQE